MRCNEELNAEKRRDLISKEVLVTLLTDGYLSNGQKERRTCFAAICMGINSSFYYLADDGTLSTSEGISYWSMTNGYV